MINTEERALLVDLQDKIIALLVEKQEARADGDERRARELQRHIDRMSTECGDIRKAAAE
jgi:hypothetical protein